MQLMAVARIMRKRSRTPKVQIPSFKQQKKKLQPVETTSHNWV
jgi:hypothetical protein